MVTFLLKGTSDMTYSIDTSAYTSHVTIRLSCGNATVRQCCRATMPRQDMATMFFIYPSVYFLVLNQLGAIKRYTFTGNGSFSKSPTKRKKPNRKALFARKYQAPKCYIMPPNF